MCRVGGVPHDHAYVVRAHCWEPSSSWTTSLCCECDSVNRSRSKNSTGLLTTYQHQLRWFLYGFELRIYPVRKWSMGGILYLDKARKLLKQYPLLRTLLFPVQRMRARAYHKKKALQEDVVRNLRNVLVSDPLVSVEEFQGVFFN